MPPGTPTPRSSHRSSSDSSENSPIHSDKEVSKSHRKRRRSDESDSGESGSSTSKRQLRNRRSPSTSRSKSSVSPAPEDASKSEENDRKRIGPRFKVRDAQEIEYWRSRRLQREKIANAGVWNIWGESPDPNDFSDHEGPKLPSDDEKSSSKKKSKSSSSKKKKADRKSSKKKHRKHKKKHHRKRAESSSPSSGSSSDWEEVTKETLGQQNAASDSGDDIIGPKLPEQQDSATVSLQAYHELKKDLLPGEGQRYAAYIASGKRIPRRGEIGLTSDEIAVFETKGYVMSGSRHKRMEATRMRKEGQVYSAEEKRMLGQLNQQQRREKESGVLSQFKTLINKKMQKD